MLRRGGVKSPFARFGLDGSKIWHPRIKSVASQILNFIQMVGFKIPSLSIAQGIAARCDILSSLALKEALQAEVSDLQAQKAGWKDWAQRASLSSASMSHRFCKAPLLLNKLDLKGSPLSRAERLDQQVEAWSALWEAPNDTPAQADGFGEALGDPLGLSGELPQTKFGPTGPPKKSDSEIRLSELLPMAQEGLLGAPLDSRDSAGGPLGVPGGVQAPPGAPRGPQNLAVAKRRVCCSEIWEPQEVHKDPLVAHQETQAGPWASMDCSGRPQETSGGSGKGLGAPWGASLLSPPPPQGSSGSSKTRDKLVYGPVTRLPPFPGTI